MGKYAFDEQSARRISAAVRRVERMAQTLVSRIRHPAMWPAPWDVGDGNENVDLRPASDTQTSADTDTWSLGDGTFVRNEYRYAWDTSAHKLLGYKRGVRYDSMGRVVAISAETEFTVDTAESC